MEVELDEVEQRVVGCLLEKERTVPDTYPMTVNGLRTGCNQSSGRSPVTNLTESDVIAALDRLRPRGLTRVIHPSHGARQPKYRQVIDEVLGLDAGARAIITLLLLRGPQTPGELRSRSERLHDFADLTEVDSALRGLAGRADPLVRELPRRSGQKEARWIHLLGPVAVEAADEAAPPGAATSPTEAVLAAGGEARDQRVLEGYAAAAGAYAATFVDELAGKPFDRWLLERVADLVDGGPLADVGCGPGHVTAHLAMAGADAHGFDLVPAMVDEARRRFPEVPFEVADLRDLPAPITGDGWAGITAWYSFVHLAGSELPQAISALTRRLRPGGWLVAAMHEGDDRRDPDELWGVPVSMSFTFHRRPAVTDAMQAAGLDEIEWFVRGPIPPETTDRLYVLGRRAS